MPVRLARSPTARSSSGPTMSPMSQRARRPCIGPSPPSSLRPAWATAQTRRAKVHVPSAVLLQTKPELALALVAQARAWGVPFAWVVADAGYGDTPPLLQGLDDRHVA